MMEVPPVSLDLHTGCLVCGTQTSMLRPKTLTVLRYLLDHAGHFVSAVDLRAAVWPGIVVGDEVLRNCIHELRVALDDERETPHFIETLPHKGYRLLGKVVSTQSSVVSLRPFTPPDSPLGTGNRQLTTPLVGREAELTQLQQWLDKATTGQRQLVFIAGEPGIGKTTLVEAFLFGVRSRKEFGVQKTQSPTPNPELPSTPRLWIGRGQCIEHYGPGEAYLPVLEALERLSQQPGQERLLPLLRQYAPMWLAQLPTLLTPEERASLQREVAGCTRERMLRELAVLLEALTAETTLVLVLEDLHWSDLSTLDLLAMLARRSEPARLLVVGTYRSSEVHTQNHLLSPILQELQAHALCHELRVEGLSEAAVAQYLEQRFPVRAFPTRFAHVLHQRTEGNPLFLVNLLEDLIQQGLLTDGAGGWAFQGTLDTLAHHVPAGSRQLITKLIGQVQPAIHQTLAAGSVADCLFSAAAVAAALDTTASEVERQCEEAVRRQLFIERAGIAVWPDGTEAARYGFRHALYQQLWHEQVSISQQQEWHQRIGVRKELAYSERTSDIAAELAVHFTQSRDSQRAIHYLRQAAEQAMLKAAPREALQHVTEAVTLLQTLPDTQERSQRELDLYLMQGALLIAARGYTAPEVGQTYTRAHGLSQQAGQTSQVLHALFGLYTFHSMRAELETAQDLSGQIYALVRSTSDPVRQAEAHLALGAVAFYRGEFERALEQTLCVTAIPPRNHSRLILSHSPHKTRGYSVSSMRLGRWHRSAIRLRLGSDSTKHCIEPKPSHTPLASCRITKPVVMSPVTAGSRRPSPHMPRLW